MPPLDRFTTKAQQAISRAHELAVERGQNHVTPLHLLTALVLQDESTVISVLEKLEVDIALLTDSLLEAIETPESATTMAPSYNLFLTPDLARILEGSVKISQYMKDDLASTEHLFLALCEVPGQAREILNRFRVNKEITMTILEELRNKNVVDADSPKKFRVLSK